MSAAKPCDGHGMRRVGGSAAPHGDCATELTNHVRGFSHIACTCSQQNRPGAVRRSGDPPERRVLVNLVPEIDNAVLQ